MAIGTDKHTLIESVFLGRLIESKLYGEPKEGLAAELTEKAPNGVTPDGLTAAANAIIRKRNNGAFPALPACLAEIERHCIEAQASGRSVGASLVTKYTWEDLAKQHCRRMGFARDKLPVVDRRTQPEEHAAWRQYFLHIGMRASASAMQNCERWTVPDQWPWNFDRAYAPPPLPDREQKNQAA